MLFLDQIFVASLLKRVGVLSRYFRAFSTPTLAEAALTVQADNYLCLVGVSWFKDK